MILPIRVTSDFICPWCLIGEARLAAALARLPAGVEADVEWLPYQLNPQMPLEGLERRAYRTRKFGSWDRSRVLDAQTVAAAEGSGVVFDYDRIARTPNTLKAHLLSRHAAKEGRQQRTVKAILTAYFTEGRDIGDTQVLADIAVAVGLDRSAAEAAMESEVERAALVAQIAATAAEGFGGVPHFDLAGRHLTGAVSTSRLLAALRSAAEAQLTAPSP
ncbi:MAG: DsbA family oxidoreductase [Rhodospirillales bacterium]